MKVLFAGDTHGSTNHIITLLDNAKASGCDRVFVLGDFGYWEHHPSGVKYLDEINRHATLRQIPIYFLDGNHDKTSMLVQRYGSNRDSEGFMFVRAMVRYAPRGHTWKWDDVSFMALGGAYSVDKDYRLAIEQHEGSPPGTQWFPEEEMTDEELHEYLGRISSVDILLTHDKPRASSPRWNRKDLPECWPNQDRVQEAVRQLNPKLLLHGHLHYRYQDWVRSGNGDWTQVTGLDCNPGAAGSKIARDAWMILDLELPLLPDYPEDDL